MQQHPVPQNITGFEFKLVGFLTLKQFIYLAATGLICFVLFVSLKSFWRWVLILPTALFGIALAFLPIQGMKFDQWIVAFFRLITSPSRRAWHKKPKTISFLAPEFSQYLRRPPTNKPAAGETRAKLESYLNQLSPRRKMDKLEALEKTRLSMLKFGLEEKLSAYTTQKEVNNG